MVCCAPLLCGAIACGGTPPPTQPPSTEPEGYVKQLAPQKEWINATTWGDELMEAYLRPYWYTREVYNETCTFVGESGEATLMYEPTLVHSVRSYDLSTTYLEGIDYEIVGRKIKRIPTGSMPYWGIEEYYRREPVSPQTAWPIFVEDEELQSQVDWIPYLAYFDNGDFITSKQIAVTYRHQTIYSGAYPEAQQDKLSAVLDKIKAGQDINIAVYGDSVSVGCNASGTSYGGNINPYMPAWFNIVKQYIEKKYDITANVSSNGQGGWTLQNCIDNYDARMKGGNYDLMLLRIGGNDKYTAKLQYKSRLAELLDKFFAEYPNANVIIVTPEAQNVVEIGGVGSVPFIEMWTEELLESYENASQVAIAKVTSFDDWLEATGKKDRDWLANNINHGNDFMIRSYVQTILKVMFGTDYVNEYEGQ